MSTRVTDLNLTIIPGKSIATGEGNGKIGKMDMLATVHKETVVGAVNEVKTIADTASTTAAEAKSTAETAKSTADTAKEATEEVKTTIQNLQNDVKRATQIAQGITAASLNIQAENVTYYSDILPLDKPEYDWREGEPEEEESEEYPVSQILDELANGYTRNKDGLSTVTYEITAAKTAADKAQTKAEEALSAAKQAQSALEVFRNEINSMIADEREF